MGVRIIAGIWRGRQLDTPPGEATRPLTDRIKQSLFDLLGQDFNGLYLADACAGSGSFAFEAASRGASRVHAIEAAPAAQRCLQRNHRRFDEPASLTLHRARFQDVLPGLTDLDLVFCDPPFPWFTEDPASLAELMCLAAAACRDDGLVVLRGERGQEPPVVPAGLQEEDLRRYGRSWIRLYRVSAS